MKDFAAQILKNLETNGFPSKKVSLPTEKMYEVADKKGHSLNTVLDYMRDEMNVESAIETEKIVFSPLAKETEVNDFGFDGVTPDMMAKAQEMMAKMDPNQLKEMKDKVMNMSDDERAKMMSEAKKMGMM